MSTGAVCEKNVLLTVILRMESPIVIKGHLRLGHPEVLNVFEDMTRNMT